MNSEPTTYIHVNPYQQLLSELDLLLAGRACVLTLTGITGTGKTALLKQLTVQLQQNRHQVLMPDPVPQTPTRLQHYLARELGLRTDCGFTDALRHHIAQLPTDRPHLTLIVDDADTLDGDTLQFIADLRGTLETADGIAPQLGILLCGSPALELRLAEPPLKPLLDDRLAAHTIEAMTRKQLLAFCITWMAAQQAIFKLDPGMLNAIAATSGNLPGAVPAVLQKFGERLAAAEPAVVRDTDCPSLHTDESDEYSGSAAQANAAIEPAIAAVPEAAGPPEQVLALNSDTDFVPAADIDAVHDPEPVLAPDTADYLDLVSTPGSATDPSSHAAVAAAPDAAFTSAIADAAEVSAMPNDGRRAGTPPAAVAVAAAIAVPDFDAELHFATWADANDLDRQRRASAFFRYTAFAASAVIAAGLAWTVFSPPADAPAIDIVAPDAGAAAQPVVDETTIATESIASLPIAAPPIAEPPTRAEEIVPEPAAAEIDAPVIAKNDEAGSTLSAPVAPLGAKAKPAPVDDLALENFVRQWLDAWQSQDLTAFFEHYHTDFVPQYHTTRAAWRNERQIRISSPADISIDIEAFEVDRSSPLGNWVSFWMTYRSPTYADRTHKEVLIGPDLDGELRILQELNLQVDVIGSTVPAVPMSIVKPTDPPKIVATAKTMEPTRTAEPAKAITVSAPASASPAPSDAVTRAYEIANFFATWLASWENQDIGAYFQHYVPDFTADGLASAKAWRNDRTAKITRPAHILLVLKNMDILESDADSALVELKLEYHTRDYADLTVKELHLTRNGGGKWQIAQETNRDVELLPLRPALSAETLAQP